MAKGTLEVNTQEIAEAATQTEKSRRDYREWNVTDPGPGASISGETIHIQLSTASASR